MEESLEKFASGEVNNFTTSDKAQLLKKMKMAATWTLFHRVSRRRLLFVALPISAMNRLCIINVFPTTIAHGPTA